MVPSISSPPTTGACPDIASGAKIHAIPATPSPIPHSRRRVSDASRSSSAANAAVASGPNAPISDPCALVIRPSAIAVSTFGRNPFSSPSTSITSRVRRSRGTDRPSTSTNASNPAAANPARAAAIGKGGIDCTA